MAPLPVEKICGKPGKFYKITYTPKMRLTPGDK